MKNFAMRMVIILNLFMLMPIVQAANYTLPLSLLGYQEDLTVKGANTNTTMFFPLPKAVIGSGSSINLYIEPSPYLNNGSLFTVLLNDKAAVHLTAGQLRQNSLVKLPVPQDAAILRGVTVNIRTGMFANDKNLCTDYRRGYLFYTIKNTSNLIMNVTAPVPRTIPDFFAGLYQGLVVVMPATPTKEEINAAVWLYGALQKAYPYQNMKVSVGAPQGLPPDLPQLWVGERNHLPPNLQGFMENLFLPFPDKLVVSANNGAELLQAARQLMTLPVYAALPVQQSIINNASQENAQMQDRSYFGNSTAQDGITNIAMDFPLYPGQLTTLPKSLGIHLEGRYSPSSIAGKPVKLDVYLNRSLLFSMALDDSGTINRDINLPEGFPLKAYNMLSVRISYPEDENICAVFGPSESAQILDSSYYVGIGAVNRDRLTWDSVGMLFSRNGLILIDENPSLEVIKAACQAMNFINSQLPPNKLAFPNIGFMSEYKNKLTADYIIAISSAGLEEELSNGLPIKLGEAKTTYQSDGQTAQITYRAGNDVVIGQLGNFQGVPLVAFQGVQSAKKLSEAINALTNASGKSMGNLYVYDDKPVFYSTFPPAKIEKEGISRFLSLPWNLWEQAYRYAGDYYKLIFMSIMVLIMIITFKWMSQRRKKG